MKRTALFAMVLLFACFVSAGAVAQRMHDPLTPAESDQLRETAQEPIKRMKLLVTFTRARMDMVNQMRSDPKMAEATGEKIRSMLEDVAQLVDEIDDNLSMYNGRSEDLRKPLKEVIEADSDWQLKLRSLKETASAEAIRTYGIALEEAADSVNASADSARAMLERQNASRGKDKEKDKTKDKEAAEGTERIQRKIEKKEEGRKCPPPC